MGQEPKSESELAAELEQLRKRLLDLRALEKMIDGTSLPFAVGTTDGKLRKINRAFCELTGYEEEELLGDITWNETLTPAKWREEEALRIAELLTTGQHQRYEKEYRRKDGSIVAVELSTFMHTDDEQELTTLYALVTDISKSKQDERDLELLHLAMAQSTEGIAVVDMAGNIQFVNDAFANMHGYSAAEIVGQNLTLFHAPEQIPEVDAANREIVETGQFRGEIWHARKDGSVFPSSMQNTLIKDASGQPAYILGTLRDITEHKQAMDRMTALHEISQSLHVTVGLKEVLRLCLDAAIDHTSLDCGGIYHLNEDGLTLTHSVGLSSGFIAQTSHYPTDSKNVQMVKAGQLIYTHYAQIPTLKSDEKTDEGLCSIAIVPIQYKSKSIACLNVSSHVHADISAGDRTMLETLASLMGAFIVRAQEEERRRIAEESLRQYARIVSSSNDMQALLDRDFIYLAANDAYASAFLKTQDEIVGHSAAEVLGQDIFDAVVKPYALQCMEGREVRYRTWFELPSEHRYLEITYFPYLSKSGAVKGFVVNGRNMTSQKQVEDQNAQLESQLQQSQKMEAIGRLAGGVAHDFNNVLCAITGHATLILDGLSSVDPLRKSMEEIDKAAQRASDMTRQLLAFSRKQVIEAEVVDLSQVIDNLHSMLTRLISEDIILRTVPQKELGMARVDPNQIEQIILNLAVNARDAMPQGGELLVETCDVELDENFCNLHVQANPGPHVMLAVSDTGCGMSAEVQEKIFEPFFTTKPVGQGTGLGLATVFAHVEQNDGIIEVYSSVGSGTSFKMYFPRVLDSAKPRTLADQPAPMGGHETILVVEDEDMVRNLAESLLSHRGYKVLSAISGVDALMVAQSHHEPIDLLLTDVVMPQMNGRELAQSFSQIHPETKVLYTSGYTKNVIDNRSVLDQGVHFIAKPYSLKTLATRVRAVLDGED